MTDGVDGRPAVDVGPAEPGDADALGALIAEAFAELPPSRWLVAEPDRWAALAPDYFAVFVAHALAGHGVVHTTGDRDAVAVWFDNTRPAQPPVDYERRLAQICGPHTATFLAFDEALAAAHPGEPHHHLAFLAVRADRQGHGLGTALLRRHHAHLDAHGIAGYLEAAAAGLRPLYARHGYEPYGAPIAPAGEPLMWPMWRTPRGRPGR